MSSKPPVTGRVQSIRSRFENLNSLEPLDISVSSAMMPLRRSPTKSYAHHQFRRSATSFDLMRNENNNRCEETSTTINTIDGNRTPFNQQKRMNSSIDIHRQSSDSALFKLAHRYNSNNVNNNNHSKLAKESIKQPSPLTEIKENVVEAINVSLVDGVSSKVPAMGLNNTRLSRHTSDPVKRGSIKRSPAFRVGSVVEKSSNTPKSKLISSPTTPLPLPITPPSRLIPQPPVPSSSPPPPNKVPDELSEHFERLLKRSVHDPKVLYSAGITDTLKAALKQPLPTGPPPKKPPRSFVDSPSQRESITTMQLFERSVLESSTYTTDGLRTKIDFLEKRLRLKDDSPQPRPMLIIPTTAATVSGGLFRSCMPLTSCTSDAPIYDTVQMYTSSENPWVSTKNATDKSKPNHPNEHIYMEPYGHLRECLSTNGLSMVIETNGTNKWPDIGDLPNCGDTKMDSITSSNCACPEEHASDDNGDLHYLCTSIDNSIKSEADTTSTDSDPATSLTNTYDEINILVNAAFNDTQMDRATKKSTPSVNGVQSSEVGSSLNTISPSPSQKSLIKLSRSLTEKRKNYVQRISARPTTNLISSSTYGTVQRTFKSPVVKTFSVEGSSDDADETPESTIDRINRYKRLVETTNTQVIHRVKKFQRNETVPEKESHNDAMENNDKIPENLFKMCLLAGYNTSTASAYIKFKFPASKAAPAHIEHLIFPSSKLVHQRRSNQDYGLILTDDQGNRIYGYCRRVVPESCDICLPLAYCILSETKAPGFYFKILKEIESRHGQTDLQSNYLLKNLQCLPVPNPGKFLHLKLPLSPRPKTIFMSNHKIMPKRLSLEVNPKWLTESAAHAAFPEADNNSTTMVHNTSEKLPSKKSGHKSLLEEFEEKKQGRASPPFDLGLISRSAVLGTKINEILIRRPNDLRLESTELSDLYGCLGADLLCNVFGSLLLERKVILVSENISLLSSCVFGLQTILYPFQWHHTLVTLLPENLTEVCQAPFPVLAGVLETISVDIEDGILVDLDAKQVQQKCGDESTILPLELRNSLLVSLEMVDILDQGKMLSSVLIAEAFLRFFVELFSGFKGGKALQKEQFVQSHPTQSVRLFLEWFVETSMFQHFAKTKYAPEVQNPNNLECTISETSTSQANSAYALFDARLLEQSENKTKSNQNMEMIMKNCKIINKKAKTFKDRFRGLFE